MRYISTQKQLLRSKRHNIKKMPREFPGCSVVRTRRFHCWGLGSIPAQGTKIPHAMQHGQEKKKMNMAYYFISLMLML